MKKAFICSAYRGNTEENIQKAKKYCSHALHFGYLPIAPHLYFPQFLNDSNKEERKLGISFGLDLLKECTIMHVYGKITEGMQQEIKEALHNKIMIVYFDENCKPIKIESIMNNED